MQQKYIYYGTALYLALYYKANERFDRYLITKQEDYQDNPFTFSCKG